MNKLNLEVTTGNGFNEQNRFALKFDIKNFDTSSVALSGLRVTSYAWLQERNILGQFTSGVNAQGNLSQFTSAIDLTNGVGQTGIVSLNLTASSYRVYHNVVNSSKIAPQLTINAPNGITSQISPVSYANNTDTYFDIILDDAPPVPGYTITWFLPGSYENYTGSLTPVSNPTITIQKISEYIRYKNRKFDTKFVISWPGNTSNIPTNWGVKDTDVYVQISPSLYPSSFVTSSWYSNPPTSLSDNPYFILEQFDGSNWNVVSEYSDFNILDNSTGISATDSTFIKIINNGTGNNKSVYIATSGSNPIASSYSGKDYLSLWSKGSVDNRRRSFVKFDTTTIPTSATGIKNAVLRLNVNSLSNAWNYSSTNGHISVYRVSADWTENEVTWSNRKAGTPWATSGGDYVDTPSKWVGNSNLSTSFTSADQNNQFWVDFDVTSIVDYWRLNPGQNYGFLVKLYDSLNENNSSDIKWELNSGRLASSGTIAGYPQLLISYNVLNTSGPTPSIQITIPETNTNIFNPTFLLQGSTSISAGAIESVSAFYRQASSITPYQYFGTLNQSNLNVWDNTFSSLSVGSYDFILRAVSDLGNFGESDFTRITFTSSPSVSVTGDSLCHSGNILIQGTIDVSNGQPSSGELSYITQYIPNDKKITCILEDRLNSGIIWVGTEGNGLYRVNVSSTNRILNYTSENSSLYNNTISDISMDSSGVIWISYSGLGVGTFNTLNWNVSTSNDWYFYNSSNSSLSAYPSNTIDICDIFIDSNDVKYFALTWNSINSVISLSGSLFNDSYITKYNLGIYPRKVYKNNGNIFVATSDNRIFKYTSGSWTNYTLPTFQNINDISVDSNSVVWIATDSGIATLSGTTISECLVSSTPNWPLGINSGNPHSKNIQAKGIFLDSSNKKYVSYSTGNNKEYNGGVVTYTSNNLSTSSTSANNWIVIDSYNNSGILSNNVYKSLKSSATGLWIVTENGLCNLNNITWNNFSNSAFSYPLSISGSNWNTNVQNPIYGNTGFNVVFNYDNNVTYTSSFYLNIEQTPSIQIIYPSINFSTIQSNSSQKILEYSIVSEDVKNGDNVLVDVDKAPTVNGPWSSVYENYNALNLPYYETLTAESFYYIRVRATNNNCSAISNVYSVYGNNLSTVYIDSLTGTYNTSNPITYTGRVVNNDFTKQIIVNGISYTDSLASVVFGYTSGNNFISVGNATLGSVTNTSAAFSFTWNSPIAGVSQLSAITTTNFGTVANGSVSFNAIVSVPSITIIKPITNDYLALNSATVLSASTQSIGIVSALNFYIQGSSSTLIGSATSSVGNVWTKSFTPSAFVSGGSYSVYATCVNISGTSSISNYIPVTINTLPTLLQISNLSATHTGTYTYQAQIQDLNSYYSNKIEIISAGSVYYTGSSNGFGDFIWNWVNPPNGNISLSAKIYDGRPSTSSDYTIVPISLNLNKATISLPTFSYPSAKKDGITLSPKVNVISTNTVVNLSAAVVGSNISNVTYWLCNYDENTSAYYKSSILSSATSGTYSTSAVLPSSRYYVSTSVSKYKFWAILAELTSTNNSTLDTDLSYFYVKEQSISGDVANTCSNPLVFSGNFLDSDIPVSRINTIIDNSVSAIIYDNTNNVYIGTLTSGIQTTESISYTYSWNNPTSSTSAVKIYLNDSYNLSASQLINYGGLDTQPTISLLSSTSYIAYSSASKAYVVSAGSISVSSTTSATKIKTIQYLISDTTKNYIVSANTNKVGSFNISANSDITTVVSYIQTSGNCVAYSSPNYYLTIQQISGNIYPDNCSNCYCNGAALNITGNFTDKNLSNSYLVSMFNYSISAYVYDNFNNLIQDITSQLNSNETQSWNATWLLPTVGATSVYLKIVDNLGNIQTISKTLSRSIYQSPQILLTTPVTYSTPNTVYNQNDSISFTSNTSSTNITVKYYANGNLIGISNNPSTNYNFDWNSDKLPGLYSISAMAINDSGCYAITSKNIMVSNVPIVNILNLVDQNHYQQGIILNVNVDAKANNPATISAVNILSNPGSLISATYDSVNLYWTSTLSALSSSVSAYSISAIAYDTLGRNNSQSIKIYTSQNPYITSVVSGNNISTSSTISFSAIDNADNWVATYNGANNDLYAFTDGVYFTGRIYHGTLTTSGITFVDTLAPNKIWNGFANGPNGKLYVTSFGGSIYQGTISGTNVTWVDTSAGTQNWQNITLGSDSKLYAVVNGGSIYQGTISGTNVTWVDTSAGIKNWDTIITSPDGKLYVTVNGGSIYQGTISGTNVTWVDTNAGIKNWKQIIVGSDYNLYAVVNGGSIYQGTISGVNVTWVDTNAGIKNWIPIVLGADSKLYAGDFAGSIYQGTISGTNVNWSNINAPSTGWLSLTFGVDGNLYSTRYANMYKGAFSNYSVSSNYNVLMNLTVNGSSKNGGYLTSSYVNVLGTNISLNNVGYNKFSVDILVSKYFAGNSNSQITVYVVDNFGAISSEVINVKVNSYSGLISYPVIRSIVSYPPSKVTYR